MSGMNFRKMNREATKKMKAQRKQEKRKQKQAAAAHNAEGSKEKPNAEL